MRWLIWPGALLLVGSSCALLLDPDDYVAGSGPGDTGGAPSGGAGGMGGLATGGSSGGQAQGGGPPVCDGADGPLTAEASWSRQLNNGTTGIVVLDVAASPDGRAYLVGRCTGRMGVFGEDTLSCDILGKQTYFIIAFDGLGHVAWKRTLTSESLSDRAAIYATDTAVWITGAYGTADDEPPFSEGCDGVASNGQQDGFLMRLEAENGDCAWLRSFGGLDHDYAADVVGFGDKVAVIGQYGDSMDLANKDLSTALRNGSVFVAAFDAARGTPVWATDLQGGNTAEPYQRIAYGGGSLFAAGTMTGAFKRQFADPGGNRDIFVVPVSPSDGEAAPAALFGGTEDDYLSDIAIGADGPVLLLQVLEGTLPVGGNMQVVSTGSNLGVVGLDFELQPRFAYSLGGDVLTLAALTTDPFNGDTVFAARSSAALVRGDVAHGADVYVGRIGCTGNVRWMERFGDGEAQWPTGLAVSSSGAVFVSGNFDGDINFGAGEMVSAPGTDGFLVGFEPPLPR